MKTSASGALCAVNLQDAAAVPQQRLGKRVAQFSSARMNEVCAALWFPLGVIQAQLARISVCPRISTGRPVCLRSLALVSGSVSQLPAYQQRLYRR
jgi:hypothetical protein